MPAKAKTPDRWEAILNVGPPLNPFRAHKVQAQDGASTPICLVPVATATPERERIARLIAAAPELEELLVRIVEDQDEPDKACQFDNTGCRTHGFFDLDWRTRKMRCPIRDAQALLRRIGERTALKGGGS